VSDYQLAQVAIMHYENGLSQQEIANLFGHSKMTVSRMLQKAKDKNIVKTEVALPFALDNTLENRLISKFDLSKATVIKTRAADIDLVKCREEVAKAAAFFFNTSLPSNSIIGIGIGRTVGQIVRNISPMKSDNVYDNPGNLQKIGSKGHIPYEFCYSRQ
jgi:DNA-binding transcriptional regulator LsrR (DeoR family)